MSNSSGDIETLVDRLYEMDGGDQLLVELGFAGGFQVPEDEGSREDIIDDLQEAIASINREVR